MTDSDTQAIRDDLAFLRGLVERGDDFLPPLYAPTSPAVSATWPRPCLVWARAWAGSPPLTAWSIWSSGSGRPSPSSMALTLLPGSGDGEKLAPSNPAPIGRSLPSSAPIGLSNLALIAVNGAVALREKSFTIWLIYPCTVFILQGAAWLTMFVLRRRAWIGAIAALWFTCALGMGWNVTDLARVYTTLRQHRAVVRQGDFPGAWLMTHKIA